MSTAAASRHVLILGGVPALIVALPLVARGDLRITIIDERPSGEHQAGVFVPADDFPDDHEGLLDSIVVARWDTVIHSAGPDIAQPHRRICFVQEAQARAELAQKPACVTLVSATPREVGPHRVSTDRGTFSADAVIDARDPQQSEPGGVHVLTCAVALARPHRLREPVLVDTGTAAGTGWSFYQYLPAGPAHLQVRAVGHGSPGRQIAIVPDEGRLLHSRRSCVPLVPQRPGTGMPIKVPFGCPDPIFPSTIPMAYASGIALAAVPSFAEADLHAALMELCDRETDRRSKLMQDCRELAAIEPIERTGYLSPS
jgi:hypothetical protein